MKKELENLFKKTIPGGFGLIPMEFLCKEFEINYEFQYRNISNDPLFVGAFYKSSNEEIFGDKRQRGHLTKSGFLKWILMLRPTIVPEHLRPIFLEYQDSAIDYFHGDAIQFNDNAVKSIRLKKRVKELYDFLHGSSPEFVEYIESQAEIARIGKQQKNLEQKIAKEL